MGNYCVNVFLDEAQEKGIQEAGLGDQIIQVEGKKAVKNFKLHPTGSVRLKSVWLEK